MPQLDTIYILGCLWKGPEEIYLGPTQQFTLEDIPLENPSEKGILGRISGLQKFTNWTQGMLFVVALMKEHCLHLLSC